MDDMEKCQHKFVFLRQDEKNVGYTRNPVWVKQDVFFCEKCLEYRRKDVEKRTPCNDGTDHVERLA